MSAYCLIHQMDAIACAACHHDDKEALGNENAGLKSRIDELERQKMHRDAVYSPREKTIKEERDRAREALRMWCEAYDNDDGFATALDRYIKARESSEKALRGEAQ